VERRRRALEPSASPGCVSLVEWLEGDADDLVADFDRLYVPRNDARWLRRNALIAAGNAGSPELTPLIEHYAEHEDPMLSETARWAAARMQERHG
jgi:epoxyqueuosine reductase QueG